MEYRHHCGKNTVNFEKVGTHGFRRVTGAWRIQQELCPVLPQWQHHAAALVLALGGGWL